MKALAIYFRVLAALMQREALTRFGRNKLGYLWAFIEPCAYLGGFVVFRGFIGSTIPFGDNLALFMLTGLITYRLAMNIAKRATGAINSNIALLTYPPVKTFDVIMARMVLEALTMLIVAAIFIFGMEAFAGVRILRQPDELISAFAAATFLGFGLGFFNATVSRVFPVWDRLWGLISFPLFFTSGIFFIPASLPPFVLGIIYWNPFLHAVEWVRSAAYIDYQAVTDHEYLLVFSTVTFFIGLFINRFYQRLLLVE